MGVYDPPEGGPSRKAVVLCQPWGQEYLRAHRSFRRLAALLAEAGHHVLRFDYFGTGDSAGDLSGGDRPSWREDISAAINELKDMTEAPAVRLCGLRMGAAWAAQVARSRLDVDRLVAWDPVIDGDGYAGALEREAIRSGDRLEVLGFALTPEALAAFREVTPAFYEQPGSPVLVLTTRDDAEVGRLLRPGVAGRVSVDHVPGPCAWEEEGDFGTSGLPVRALHRILEWLK